MTAQDLLPTNQIFENEVVGQGDFSALARVYTKGARILPPGTETITGTENIQNFWRDTAVALGVTALKLRTVEVEFQQETAVEIGRATISTSGNGEIDVKYVVYWKQEDGSWKWDIDIWNAVS